ncbi:MAG: nitrous oxide reductase family maturation protein NosD [Streptosporangiaceae bacterium]|jgi:parallel beta-helix repeat protein
MGKTIKGTLALSTGGTLLAFGALGTGAAQAAAMPATVYVSPAGSAHAAGTSCATASFTSINAAIAAVRPGSTVVACRGTYREDADASKPLTLRGENAVINAAGQPGVVPGAGGNAVTVLAPQVTVEGLKVENGSGDGILVVGDHARVTGNTAVHNGSTGIDLNGTQGSVAAGNTADYNQGGGFYIADDAGPTAHNTVTGNVAYDNPGGCGFILASHSAAGVYDNTVSDNHAIDNGTDPQSPGSGIILASDVANGAVYDNTVEGNVTSGNGLSGITLHAHLPGQHMNGNVITGNDVGTNNLLGDPIGLQPPGRNVPDDFTTGILVASSSPLLITITGNTISDNRYGIWSEGFAAVTGGPRNTYRGVAVATYHVR